MLVVAVGILVGWRAGLSVSVTRAIILPVLSVLIYELVTPRGSLECNPEIPAFPGEEN